MHFQFHRRDPSTKCVLSYTGIFSGTIRKPKYQGTSISTSFVESENPLWINFGSIPASVRWIELFEKLSEELGCPVSWPDRKWTIENTQKCWSNVRNILQERKADLSLKTSDTDLSKFLNVDQNIVSNPLEHIEGLKSYLSKVFESKTHPLEKVMRILVLTFEASYSSQHPAILHIALRNVSNTKLNFIYRGSHIRMPDAGELYTLM